MTTTYENAKELRMKAMQKALETPGNTLAQRIKNRFDIAWGEWKPDYEGWLKWSGDLYKEDAIINAIDGEKIFSDYQASMKYQRDACYMEMGPIEQAIVEDNVIALVYHMYLTPKQDNAKTIDMMITEYNAMEEKDGKLRVTRLDLYTDGGGLTV